MGRILQLFDESDQDTMGCTHEGNSLSGIDSVAGFTLEGSVAANGDVQMRKDYSGFNWDWRASMTPFGIVGRWGRGNNPHGHFWLWKKEWC
jgi:hypothetical protein